MVIKRQLAFTGYSMPELVGDAYDCYVKAYGPDRYQRYLDPKGTFHGGVPPQKEFGEIRNVDLPAFFHRPEHDVESLYWSIVSALLLVKPKSAPKEDYASSSSVITWDHLLGHNIPNEPVRGSDTRDVIMEMDLDSWTDHFHNDMADVALLLFQISKHVRCEYAMWEGNLQQDHLHEAVQRLILDYLVKHRENPIELDPDNLRPTKGEPPKLTAMAATYITSRETGESGTRGTGNRICKSLRGSRGGKGSKHNTGRAAAKRPSQNAVAGPSRQSRDRAPASGKTSCPNYT